MSSYEDLEHEYNANLARIRSFLAGTRNTSTLRECQRLADLAGTTLDQMAAAAANDNYRQQQVSIKRRREIEPLAAEIRRSVTEYEQVQLFASSTSQSQQSYMGSNASSDMQALISSSDSLLRESQQILAETEQIGTETLLQMGAQREQLEQASSGVMEIQVLTSRAATVLGSMSRRAWRNKLSLYGMIAFLVWANLYVLYLMYRKRHPKHTDDEPGVMP